MLSCAFQVCGLVSDIRSSDSIYRWVEFSVRIPSVVLARISIWCLTVCPDQLRVTSVLAIVTVQHICYKIWIWQLKLQVKKPVSPAFDSGKEIMSRDVPRWVGTIHWGKWPATLPSIHFLHHISVAGNPSRSQLTSADKRITPWLMAIVPGRQLSRIWLVNGLHTKSVIANLLKWETPASKPGSTIYLFHRQIQQLVCCIRALKRWAYALDAFL